jgi:hypothetical protein
LAPSSDDSNRLQPSSGFSRTLQQKPATIPVQAGSGVLGDIGKNAVTRRAEYIRYSTDEEMIWQESPSPALLLPRFIKYSVLMAIVLFCTSVVKHFVDRNPALQSGLESTGIHSVAESRPPTPARKANHKPKSAHRTSETSADTASADATTDATQEMETPRKAPVDELGRILAAVNLGFAGVFTVLLLAYVAKLKTTKYSASSQRLIVEEGALHSVNRPYELHQLGDAVIVKPLLLRFFGVANLVITSPPITLYGLRNAQYVRDILRQGGQLEAQRVDKIRFR